MKVLEKIKDVRNGGIESFVFNTTSLITDLNITYYSDVINYDNNYKDVVNALNRDLIIPNTNFSEIKFKPLRVLKKYLAFTDYCKKNNFDVIFILTDLMMLYFH